MKYRSLLCILSLTLALPFSLYAQDLPVDTVAKTVNFEFTGFHQELTWNPNRWAFDQIIDVGIKNTGQTPAPVTITLQVSNSVLHIGEKTISKTITLDQNQSFQETFRFNAPKFSFLTTQSTLSFQNNSSKSSPTISAWTIPWIETLVLAALLGIWLFIFLIRGFAIQYKKARLPIYDVQEGDSVGSVADKTNTPWKKLVLYNRLKKPYTLVPGTALYVHCIVMDLEKEVEVTGGDTTEQPVETTVMDKKTHRHFPTWVKLSLIGFLVVGILSLCMILFVQYQQKQVDQAIATFQTPLEPPTPIEQPAPVITEPAPVLPVLVAPAKKDIHTEVLNGTTLPGKAQQIKTGLVKAGFVVDSIGNSQKSNISLTAVYHGKDQELAAKLVADTLNALGYQTSIIFDANLPEKPLIRIIIGKTGLPQ